MKVRLAIMLVLLTAVPPGARASEPDSRFELGVIGGFFLPDKDLSGKAETFREVESEAGLRGAYRFTGRWGLFADVLKADINTNTAAGDADLLTFRVGGRRLSRPYGRDGKARSYFDLGWSRLDADLEQGADFTRDLVSVGFGQRYALDPRTRMHWELRFDRESEYASAKFLVGVSWGFEEIPQRPRPPTAIDAATETTETTVTEAAVDDCCIADIRLDSAAAHGQAAKLLEFLPGVDVAQSGLHGHNVNVRGFNRAPGYGFAIRVDGRDLAEPFFGLQDWSAFPTAVDSLAGTELERGPAGARYGMQATSGAAEYTELRANEAPGGRVRIVGGDPEAAHADLRWTGRISRRWNLRLDGGVRQDGDFSVSRRTSVEYSRPCDEAAGVVVDCLPLEAVALDPEDDVEILFGSVRLDRELDTDGGRLTVEAGLTDVTGPVAQTDNGRIQLGDVSRYWARTAVTRGPWRAMAYHDRRDADRQTNLQTGADVSLRSDTTHVEVEGRWDCLEAGRGNLEAGLGYTRERLESLGRDSDPTGPTAPAVLPVPAVQPVTFDDLSDDERSMWVRFEWNPTPRIDVLLAGRWVDGSRLESRFSPWATVRIGLDETQQLRVGYQKGFREPTHAERSLRADLSSPIDLGLLTDSFGTPLNGFCVPDCGLAETRVLALGNEDLELEEVTAIELEYRKMWSDRAHLQIDVHRTRHENLIGGLVPQLSPTSSWTGSPDAEANLTGDGVTVADEVRAQLPSLANGPGGSTELVAAGYANFGEATTFGADVAFKLCFRNGFVSSSYSWLDSDVDSAPPGLEQQLLPNSPKDKFVVETGYISDVDPGAAEAKLRDRFTVTLQARRAAGFRWVDGLLQGEVEAYTSVDFGGGFAINDRMTIGVHVANLMDDEHWETFGGDRIGRRALGHLVYAW